MGGFTVSSGSWQAFASGRISTKIEVACTCGKRYKVPRAKAGKVLRCGRCRTKLRVPDDALTSNDCQEILSELGIDPAQAREEYETEKKASLACFYCAARLIADELAALEEAEQPVCFTCKAGVVGQRGEAAPGAEPEEEERGPSTAALVRRTTPEQAHRKSIALGALLLCGIGGPLHVVFGLSLLLALPLAAAIAFGAARAYRAQLV